MIQNNAKQFAFAAANYLGKCWQIKRQDAASFHINARLNEPQHFIVYTLLWTLPFEVLQLSFITKSRISYLDSLRPHWAAYLGIWHWQLLIFPQLAQSWIVRHGVWHRHCLRRDRLGLRRNRHRFAFDGKCLCFPPTSLAKLVSNQSLIASLGTEDFLKNFGSKKRMQHISKHI